MLSDESPDQPVSIFTKLKEIETRFWKIYEQGGKDGNFSVKEYFGVIKDLKNAMANEIKKLLSALD